MKPPEEAKRNLVRQWVNKAEEDFLLAEHLVEEDSWFKSAIGFHLQQSAEKYLKALLVYYQIEFPKKHDIGELLDIIAQKDAPLAKTLENSIDLNPYAVEHRYPGAYSQLTEKEVKAALKLAQKVRKIIKTILKIAK
jgi:HEPN domain-containing protein